MFQFYRDGFIRIQRTKNHFRGIRHIKISEKIHWSNTLREQVQQMYLLQQWSLPVLVRIRIRASKTVVRWKLRFRSVYKRSLSLSNWKREFPMPLHIWEKWKKSYWKIVEFINFSAGYTTDFTDGRKIIVIIRENKKINSTTMFSTFFTEFSIDIVGWRQKNLQRFFEENELSIEWKSRKQTFSLSVPNVFLSSRLDSFPEAGAIGNELENI